MFGLWSSDSPAKESVEPKPPSLEELARLVKDEASARRAALSEMQKQLDWRFIHFTDDFQRRVEELEVRITESGHDRLRGVDDGGGGLVANGACKERSSNLLPPFEAIRQSLAESDARRAQEGGLEGKLAVVEGRVMDIYRLEQALEGQFVAWTQDAEARLGEAEAWLKHLDRRVADTEYQLGGRRGATGRLTPVERLTLDGGCGGDLRSTTGSNRSGGSSCRHDAVSWRGASASPLEAHQAVRHGGPAGSAMPAANRSVSMSTMAATLENASPSSSLHSVGTSLTQQAALQASFQGFSRR